MRVVTSATTESTVNIRFAFFVAQMVIGVYWVWALLGKPA
jgi:hypothetical protein